VRRFALGWLVWRVFGPEIQPRTVGIQRRPMAVSGRTVLVGERELFVREMGPAEAPPVVLIHGMGFDGEMTYHRLAPLLADRYRVVIPDHRTFGKSDWPRGRYEISDLADDLAGVLDAIGIGAATVFGYSLGGMVAQELAYRHPRHVARLVLAGTAAVPIPRFRVLARVAFWLGRAVMRLSRVDFAMATTRVMRRSGAIAPEHLRWLRGSLLRRDPTLYYEAGHAALRFDSRSWIGGLRVPTMVIVPTRDQVVLPGAQYDLAARLRDPTVVELAGARHESIINRAEEYAATVAEFVG
jgi:pimeloyl-ACP methyl ester carboxylesterase